jgi:hypothetical protein
MGRYYEQVRRELPKGPNRTARFEPLIRQASHLASSYSDPAAVEQLFRTDEEGNRLISIGIMHAKPGVASVEVLQEAFADARSGYEQYQAFAPSQPKWIAMPTPSTALSCVSSLLTGSVPATRVKRQTDVLSSSDFLQS